MNLERITLLKAADVGAEVPGGMNQFMLRSGEALEQLGHRVDYLFRARLAPRLPTAVLRRLVVPWLVVLRVRNLLRDGLRYDVVEIPEPEASAYCLCRRRLPWLKLPPCVVVAHGVAEAYWHAELERWRVLGIRGRLRSRLTVPLTLLPQSRYALRHADHILTSASEDATYAISRLGLPADRVTVMSTGVSESYFDSPPPRGAGPLRVIFVSTWIDRKGTRELTTAWAELHRRHPDARLTVACSAAPEEKVLPRFGASRSSVSVIPFMSDEELRQSLSQHDVFVLPSWYEGGASLASVQAAAAGLACVVTDIGGHTALFRAEQAEADGAILIPPHRPEAVLAALQRLAADRPLVRELGRRARQRARSFSWRTTAEQSLRGYRAALAAQAAD